MFLNLDIPFFSINYGVVIKGKNNYHIRRSDYIILSIWTNLRSLLRSARFIRRLQLSNKNPSFFHPILTYFLLFLFALLRPTYACFNTERVLTYDR
jgi:hypothetical protein